MNRKINITNHKNSASKEYYISFKSLRSLRLCVYKFGSFFVLVCPS